MSIEEDVHEVHLTDDIDQVQKLAEDELANVDIVSPDVPEDVVDDDVPLVVGRLSPCVQRLRV